MKTVGLLSGGKDSVYNLLHCIANGHEPIALASLGPAPGLDEIDSYMYQTVGHSGLASIAASLELPLFTHIISGTAVNQEGEYGARGGASGSTGGVGRKGTEGDETEDLFELLRKVKEAMPEVQGVACGAILSNYQRVRVEHVCSRLGLTPVAYLWERNQSELLGEMVAAEMGSVLVKVAGAGLEVEHLGKSLKEMETTLHRLNRKYQLHVCGEGGEYETFTLDCPIFRQRINLSKTTTVVSNDDPYSTIAHLHLDECSLVPKPEYPVEAMEQRRARVQAFLAVPPILEEKYSDLEEQLEAKYGSTTSVDGEVESKTVVAGASSPPVPTVRRVGDWIGISEVTAWSHPRQAPGATISIEEEVKRCFQSLSYLLSQERATILDISHLTLYLSPSSMSLFPLINTVYSSYFGTAPPTRACVSIHMPEDGVRIKFEAIAEVGGGERKSLHVQSLSYWAAANIGPYSQGVTVGERLFVAGQIALIPASLLLPSPPNFNTEAALSLQHVSRVSTAAKEGRWKGWCEGGVCWIAGSSPSQLSARCEAAEEAWEDFDGEQPPMLFVAAATLPKGAAIEWQVTFATGREEGVDEDDQPLVGKRVIHQAVEASHMESYCSSSVGKAFVSLVGVSMDAPVRPLAVKFDASEVHLIRAFHLPSVPASEVLLRATAMLGLDARKLPPISVIATPLLEMHGLKNLSVAFLCYGVSGALRT